MSKGAIGQKYFTESARQREKFRDFEILKEYKYYYLCGKFVDGKLLYKECFSKFDVDKSRKVVKKKHGPIFRF